MDNSQYIDRSELKKIFHASLRAAGVEISPAQLNAAIKAIMIDVDIDGDGQISFAEFVEMNKTHPEIIEGLKLPAELIASVEA
jgi:Ca2+-binding EF-hand superfamily protein